MFFAEDKSGQKVAIKKLKLQKRGKDYLPVILREISIVATSNHQNIVSYLESFIVEDELWVVMEYMSGGSLYQLVEMYPRGVRFSEGLSGYVIHELLSAVAFLHGMKRIHRDIKGMISRLSGN